VPADVMALLDGHMDKPVRQHELRDCLTRLYQALPSTPSAPRTSALPAIPQERSQMRILLAEDNKINQKYAQALLGKRFHLTIAENGVQAVEQMRRHDYDVVLMDIQMPELDGPGATREIRALPAPKCHVPIIAMTANAQPGAREDYLAAGMDDYVTKPISPPELLALLERFQPPAPASVQAADPLLDAQAVQGLAAMMGADGLNDLLLLFTQDARGNLDAATAGLDAGDLAATVRAAHALVSSAGNVGARRFSLLARDLETAAKSGDAAMTRDKLTAMENCWQATMGEIAAYVENPHAAVA
jgi:CheY-like chemotaxis protein